VTFDDAVAFSNWLSGKAGRAAALPTEAQWEFAARLNSTSDYPSGAAKATQPAALGWSKTNAGTGAHPVGEKSPNGLGLFDMAGNVAEWCRDWYGPYASGPVTDPLETRQNLSDKPRRVLRGGSWLRDPKNGRSAARHRNAPGSRNADNGFRVVAEVGASRPAAPPQAVGASAGSGAQGGVQASREISILQALALLAGFLATGFAVIYGMWRMVLSRMMGGVSAGVKAVIGEDGFTLKAPRVPAGHKIHYSYLADGQSRNGSIVFSGDPSEGQTVYTGGRPSMVNIIGVTAPGQAAPTMKPKPAQATRSRTANRNDDDSFRGYPSAYR
jgi:hypothetical protein